MDATRHDGIPRAKFAAYQSARFDKSFGNYLATIIGNSDADLDIPLIFDNSRFTPNGTLDLLTNLTGIRRLHNSRAMDGMNNLSRISLNILGLHVPAASPLDCTGSAVYRVKLLQQERSLWLPCTI